MSTDLQNDYSEIKSKISAYRTTNDSKRAQVLQTKQREGDSFAGKKSSAVKQLEDFNANTNKAQKEVKNQLDELLEIFTISTPDSNYSSINLLVSIFTDAALATKGRIKDIVISETISTIGCSQEQQFDAATPLYIPVRQVDVFKQLMENPDDLVASFLYEKEDINVGTIPFSMNRELYKRTQNIGNSYNQDYSTNYVGASGQDLFNIEYVTQDGNGVPGDYFKVILSSRQDNINRVSDFLVDYYSSINVLDFEVLYAKIMNLISGAIDFSLNVPKDQLEIDGYFQKILQRIMGLCFDSRQEIDVAGTAKLSELDFIDDSFYELSPQDLRTLNNEIENIVNGVVEFEDCGNVLFPINKDAMSNMIQQVRDAQNDTERASLVEQSLNQMSEDPNWLLNYPSGLQINLAVKLDFLRKLPKAIMSSIISPKVLLGMMIIIKSLKSTIADLVEDVKTFLLSFKNYIIQIMSKILAIFKEELFKLIKKNVKRLVENLLLDIATEAKDKRLRIVGNVAFILLQVFSAVVDYRRCKSIVDEILKLLKLGLRQLNLDLPAFTLFGSQFLGGVSDTRAFANVIENLQKSGLPTGDLPDGTPNQMNLALLNLIKGQNLEQIENGKTEIWIPPLAVAAFGAGSTSPTKAYGKSY
jgi:hypothetical protein